MAKEDIDDTVVDDITPNEDINIDNSLHIPKQYLLCSYICLIVFFIIACIFSTIIFGLIWGANKNYKEIDGFIVSTVEDYIDEFAPNSTYPCIYPAFEKQYPNTFLCNDSSSYYSHYCSIGYACVLTQISGTYPLSCISETLPCYDNEFCVLYIESLDIYNDTSAIRIIENTIPSNFVPILTVIVIFCILILLVSFGIIWHPYFRLNSLRILIIYAIIAICIIILLLSLFISGIITLTKIPQEGTGCFAKNVDEKLSPITKLFTALIIFITYHGIYMSLTTIILLFIITLFINETIRQKYINKEENTKV